MTNEIEPPRDGRGKHGDPRTLEAAIGRYLRRTRVEAGYETQGAFAKEVNLDTGNVSKWERGLSMPSNPMQTVALYARTAGHNLEEAWLSIIRDWIAHQPTERVRELSRAARQTEKPQRRQRQQ